MISDIVNGLFEFVGALFIFLNILKLYNDKRVKGVSWLYLAFFTSWGYWNLYYYPSLNQWGSFSGGVCIVIANTIWLGQMLYYIRKERYDNIS